VAHALQKLTLRELEVLSLLARGQPDWKAD
jgi:DNA-binding CsgD family transcriptional regulator